MSGSSSQVLASFDGKLDLWDESTDGIRIEERAPEEVIICRSQGETEDTVPKEGLARDIKKRRGGFEAKKRQRIKEKSFTRTL